MPLLASLSAQAEPFFPGGALAIGLGLVFGGGVALLKRRWFGLTPTSVEGKIMTYGGFAAVVVGLGLTIIGLIQV